MPNHEPLKKGQEVFIRRPIQIYATVLEPPRDEAQGYCVRIHPLKQYYGSDDLEASQKPVLKSIGRLDFSEREQEVTESITRRAYELFESRGFAHGHDGDDWMRAQSEILLNVPVDIRETETELTVRADVPGFNGETLEIRVAPRSICIDGMRHEKSEQNEGNTVYSERHADRIFRVLDLPSEVDPDTMDLTLNDGILEIRVSKVATVEKIAPLVKRASA
jgi:HSP20 family protein